MPAKRTPSPWLLGLVGLACGASPGCHSAPPKAPDAGPAVVATTDVGARARTRRPRRRRPVARTPNAPQVAASEPAEPEDDEGPAPPRPRMTETGPTLPEDLGPPPSMEMDLTQGNQGPMGLEPAQVRRAMDPLMARLGNCAAATTDESGRGPRGRVNVRLRVHGDGRPTAARVSGGGGSAEFVLCVRRVVASSRFDHFAGPDVFVTWGFDVD